MQSYASKDWRKLQLGKFSIPMYPLSCLMEVIPCYLFGGYELELTFLEVTIAQFCIVNGFEKLEIKVSL